MANDDKTHRLKEPTAQQVMDSLDHILKVAAEQVMMDHRGDVLPGEWVQLTKVYLTRAQDALDQLKRQDAKEKLVKLAEVRNFVEGTDTVH